MRSVSQSWISSDCKAGICKPRKTLKIGTALTLDHTSKWASLGSYVQKAYTLYFNWLNEKRGGVNISGEMHWVQLVLMDDQSDKGRVTSITKYLVNELNISHLLAPYSSGLTGMAAAVANDSGAVLVAPCAASTSVFKDRPRVFGTLPLTSAFMANVFENP